MTGLPKRWNASKTLQLGLYTAWPIAVLWVLLFGPQVFKGGTGAIKIKQTITEDEVLTFSMPDESKSLHPAHSDVQVQLAISATLSSRQRQPVELKQATVSEGKGAADDVLPDKSAFSSLKVYASHGGNGRPDKYYYSFRNVRLTRKKLQFFAPEGFEYPKQPSWVDIVTGNASAPQPPTMLVIKGEAKNTAWYYLPIKYFHSPAGPENCQGWIDKPAYFLQVRYSYNIWHTWNEGLMGAFQTLREQGMLPLVQVDGEGNMRELWEGAGSHPCPLVFDPVTNITRLEDTCLPRTGAVSERHCDSKNQRWCRPGVWSYDREDGPLIIPYTHSSVMNQWAQIYGAMSQDVRDWSKIEGYCFRNLIVGKTSTLNYYQSMNASRAPAQVVEERAEAMGVFKAFVTTAQQAWVRKQAAKKPSAAWYKGYKDKALERLRKGIGVEDIDLVDSIMPSEVPGLVVEEAHVLARLWEKKLKQMEEEERDKELASTLDQLDHTMRGGAQGKGSTSSAAAIFVGKGGEGAHTALFAHQDGSGNGGSTGGTTTAGENGSGRSLRRSQITEGGAGSGSGSAQGGSNAGSRASGTTDPTLANGGGAQQQQQQQRGMNAEGRGAALRLRRALLAEGAQGVGQGVDPSGQQQQGAAAGEAQGVVLQIYDDNNGDDDAYVEDDEVASTVMGDGFEDEDDGVFEDGGSGGGGVGSRGGVEGEMEEEEPAEPLEPSESAWEKAVQNMPPVVHKAPLPLESPRPMVTYIVRNFFSRRVLNDHSLLRFILSRYNVTLRVTTLEEPLQVVMDTMQHTDVLIGMHGAGWTNALFIKHGATAVQLYPYGWQLPSGRAIRGHNYREIVLANKCNYLEWFNPHAHYAFMRREDISKEARAKEFRLHFDPKEALPTDGWPGNKWIYQNTYVDMESLGPVIDEAMRRAGIPLMDPPLQQHPKQASLAARVPPGTQHAQPQGEVLPTQHAQQQPQGEVLPTQHAQQQQPQVEVLPTQHAQQQQQQQVLNVQHGQQALPAQRA